MSAAEDVSEDIVDEILEDLVKEIAKEEMVIVERDKKLQKYFKVSFSKFDKSSRFCIFYHYSLFVSGCR